MKLAILFCILCMLAVYSAQSSSLGQEGEQKPAVAGGYSLAQP